MQEFFAKAGLSHSWRVLQQPSLLIGPLARTTAEPLVQNDYGFNLKRIGPGASAAMRWTYIRTRAVISDEADARGWRRVTLSVGSVDHAAIEILRFGADAEVGGPPELRAEMAEIVGMLAMVYADDHPPRTNVA